MSDKIKKLWSQVLERLQLELSRPTFETWIKTAIAEELENNCLVIGSPGYSRSSGRYLFYSYKW